MNIVSYLWVFECWKDKYLTESFTNAGVSNIEIIRNIKKDCESSDHHVLCPKTFACIAKDFLCDGDNGK